VNVLILGGTVFLSRAVATTLVARGHRVTTFTRGTHDVDRHLPIVRIIGDRARDLAGIPREGWDAGILRPRPLAETVRATRAWHRERGSPALQCGLSPEREAEILTAWHAVI
jgi:nucleoside-diphosphate-sugar epimerase